MMTTRPNRADLVVAAALLAVGLATHPAEAHVYLNEITVQGPETVELYNSGPAIVDVNGWTLSGSGSWNILGAPPIPVNGYLVLEPIGDIFDNTGGYIELLDGPIDEDGVHYGQIGSAPLPPDGPFSLAGVPSPTLARAPDGSTWGAPPTPSPSGDGSIWTIDPTPTMGAINDAPTPSLGASISLNELDPKPVGGGDTVELFNPLAVPIDVTDWFLCNGDAFLVLSGSVPGLGYLTITTGAGFELEAKELVYLFRDDGVRVDQIGFHLPPVRTHSPWLDFCQCYARLPDGAGPTNGYDWFSSGGGVDLLRLVCTAGGANQPETSCDVTGAPVPGGIEESSWSRVKAHWYSGGGR